MDRSGGRSGRPKSSGRSRRAAEEKSEVSGPAREVEGEPATETHADSASPEERPGSVSSCSRK